MIVIVVIGDVVTVVTDPLLSVDVVVVGIG